jgi:hypothetical protein
MGEVAGVYGCAICETDSGDLLTIASYLTFGDGKVAFVSDHFRDEEIANYGNAVPIFENSVLLFDVPEEKIQKRNYPQNGTVIKEKDEYIHINEVSFPCGEQFLIYCLVLPHGYYPTNFFSGKPHFAGFKGGRIAITWWFKEKTTIKVGFRKDPKKAMRFNYVDKPTFSEKYPKLKAAYEHAEAFAAKILSNKIPDGGT